MKRIALLLAALLPLAGCGDCLKFNVIGGGGSSNCSTAEGIGTGLLLAPVVIVAAPFVLVYMAVDAATDAPAPPRRVRAVRECPSGQSCVLRVTCPSDVARCDIPGTGQSCPGGQSCTFPESPS